MNKIIILVVLLVIIITVLLVNTVTGEIISLSQKIDFLENELATERLHYEWLKEITNSLLGENSREFMKELRQFEEQREINPKI